MGTKSIIQVIGGIIAIFVFVTGIQNIPSMLGRKSLKNSTDIRSGEGNKHIEIEIRNDSSFFGFPGDNQCLVVVTTENSEKTLFAVKGRSSFSEAKLSPDKKRVAAISRGDFIHIANIDGDNYHKFHIKTGHIAILAKNLIWTSDRSIRLYLGSHKWHADEMTLDNKKLSGPGVYELNINEYNGIEKVIKYN